MSWARYFTGWATVRISGAEPEKVLYAMAERGIVFWGAVPPVDFSLTVKVPHKAAQHLPRLAQGLGCEAEVVRRHGIPSLLAMVRRRFVLIGCVVMVVLALVVSNFFVWEIDVEGNENIPTGVIRAALADCGVDIGAYWPAFSQDQIRNSVILHVGGIRWMTVTIRGSHARVIVREARIPIEPVDEGEYVNIVAKKAGLIETVYPKRGTAQIEPNQAALPGDVLIGGYATGRLGVQGPVRAIGDVIARTWYELTAKTTVTEDEKVYSGGSTVRWALILGKTRINFYKGSSICPTGCDKITIGYTPAQAGVFTLPVTLEKTVFTPYGVQDAENVEKQSELEGQLMETLLDVVGEDGEIISYEFTTSQKGDIMYVTLRAECREQIGIAVPLTADDLMEIESKIPKPEDSNG